MSGTQGDDVALLRIEIPLTERGGRNRAQNALSPINTSLDNTWHEIVHPEPRRVKGDYYNRISSVRVVHNGRQAAVAIRLFRFALFISFRNPAPSSGLSSSKAHNRSSDTLMQAP